MPIQRSCTLFMRNEAITLKPRKLKTIGYLLISCAFVFIGFIVIDENALLRWSSISFFGLGVIVFIIQLIPDSTYLRLTRDGFEVRSLYKSNFTKWDEIKSFRAGSLTVPTYTNLGTFISTNKKMVFYDYKKSHKKYRIGKSLSGRQAALPDLYGMKVDELAKLMNKWKNKNSVQQLSYSPLGVKQ